MNRIIFLVIVILTNIVARAQVFGSFPPNTRWKQIGTDTFRLIYTGGAEDQAERIATLIQRAARDSSVSFPGPVRRINVVLQSHTTLANGYVALAPFRSEFFLIPSSNIFEFGNLPWHENLAIHEYRHVQQYNYFRRGLSKGLYYLFGEGGQALGNALTVPDWFFEGDAVHQETALSNSGRGRLGYFLSGYRSLWEGGKHYNWQKLRNGSLKDYVPDHYQLGYLLVNYGYLKYGPQFWEKVTGDAASFKGLVYPFQQAIKRYAGVDYKTFRNQALQFYKKSVDTSGAALPRTTVNQVFYSQPVGKDSLIYLKSTYRSLPAFYIHDASGEHKIGLQSITAEEWFSYRNGMIAYTATSVNPRWGLIDYSDIVIMRLNGGEKRITSKARYYTPDISPSGQRLIAVKFTDSLETELQVLDLSGTVLQSIPAANHYYFVNPRFVDEQTVVLTTRMPDGRAALQLLNLETGSFTELVPFSLHTIGQPFAANGRVYFTSNAGGNDDLYTVALKDKKIYQITRGGTGNYFPSMRGDSLYWSHFTANGLKLHSMALDPAGWSPVTAMQWNEWVPPYPVALEHPILVGAPSRFSEKRYDKSTGLFNFHSWTPNYIDPEFTFSLSSDNILNTFSNTLLYRYNRNESSHGVGWYTSYGGWFPVITAGAEYTFNRTIRSTSRTFTLNQFETRLGFNIPLNFSRGKTFRFFNGGSDYVYNTRNVTGAYKDSFSFPHISYLQHFITWAQYLPRARQHIYPKAGYSLAAYLRHSVNKSGYQELFNGQVFLPSIGNHSIVVSGSFQQSDTSNTVFGNRMVFSRGYEAFNFARSWRLSGNYHFPLLYPDLGIANIVYFQRVRANAFYDHSRVYSNSKLLYRDLRSVGGEVYFDTRWWNQLPVTVGFRVSHLLDQGFLKEETKGSNWFEVILPVSLINL